MNRTDPKRGRTCEVDITFTISERLEPPVYMYYKLTGKIKFQIKLKKVFIKIIDYIKDQNQIINYKDIMLVQVVLMINVFQLFII